MSTYPPHSACVLCTHQQPPGNGWPTWGCDQFAVPSPSYEEAQAHQDWWDAHICDGEPVKSPCPRYTDRTQGQVTMSDTRYMVLGATVPVTIGEVVDPTRLFNSEVSAVEFAQSLPANLTVWEIRSLGKDITNEIRYKVVRHVSTVECGRVTPADDTEQLPPLWELHVNQRAISARVDDNAARLDLLDALIERSTDLPTYNKVDNTRADHAIAGTIVWVAFPVMAVVLAFALYWSMP